MLKVSNFYDIPIHLQISSANLVHIFDVVEISKQFEGNQQWLVVMKEIKVWSRGEPQSNNSSGLDVRKSPARCWSRFKKEGG